MLTVAPILLRITPAHAGNTLCLQLVGLLCRDHPRTRGEHKAAGLSPLAPIGSPPHTRGTLCADWIDMYGTGITPAHAGNT